MPRDALAGGRREFEGQGVLESYDEDAFTMLGHEGLGINDLGLDVISKIT